ncbi:MAG: hypothetical protein OXG80_09560 [Chloroflexi bacterium]|nr:hypothetical protein [Chloroflexota bacterium]
MTRNRVVLTAALLSHIFAWAATLFFIFWPVYSGVSVRAGESGSSSVSGKTLIEVNGLWAALLIVLPIIFTAIALIASLPSVARPRLMLTLRWTAFALLFTFCAVGALSIGIFYLPAAIAALVAAIAARASMNFSSY